MNGVATGRQSSQCVWSAVPDHGARVVESLSAARSVAVVSAAPHSVPSCGARRSLTVAALLQAGVAAALSQPRNDTHDVVFVRDGTVWLLLAADSYYKAGLEAKKCGPRYLAVYDTRVPGKRLDRFKWALENTLTREFDFLVATDARAADESSTPVPLLVPPLHPPAGADEATADEATADEAMADWANQVIEWAGLAALSPHLLAGHEPAVDEAICANYTPDAATQQTACVSRTTGFFTAAQIRAIWSGLQTQEWAVMSVQGFAHMPITRSGKPRSAGELGYTLIKSGSSTSTFRYVH